MSWLDSIKAKFQLDQIQWIPLQGPKSFHFYQEWLEKGHFGEMSYLERHAPKKEQPRLLLPDAQSVIMITKSYVPIVRPHEVFKNLRVAAYAQNQDYHHWFYSDLDQIALELQAKYPETQYLVGTDSLAFLERDHAVQAGLGWIGKNTCVINRKHGSFFFIGEILTNLPAPKQELPPNIPDFCGHCQKCIEICPTNAIEAPKKMNATKCISYWTIESKTIAPLGIREHLNDWFFGCDLCQSICPWNQKPFAAHSNVLDTKTFLQSSENYLKDLRQILTLSDEDLKKIIRGTPFERSKPFGLRRNALYVIGNRNLKELQNEVSQLTTHPQLAELALWTLEKIKHPTS